MKYLVISYISPELCGAAFDKYYILGKKNVSQLLNENIKTTNRVNADMK